MRKIKTSTSFFNQLKLTRYTIPLVTKQALPFNVFVGSPDLDFRCVKMLSRCLLNNCRDKICAVFRLLNFFKARVSADRRCLKLM